MKTDPLTLRNAAQRIRDGGVKLDDLHERLKTLAADSTKSASEVTDELRIYIDTLLAYKSDHRRLHELGGVEALRGQNQLFRALT